MIAGLLPSVWPLAFILVALLILKQVRTDVRPIFVGIVSGLAETSKKNSLFYAMAIAYALAASLQALADVSRDLHWPLVEAFAKVTQPGVVAIIAYVNKPPAASVADPVIKPAPTP